MNEATDQIAERQTLRIIPTVNLPCLAMAEQIFCTTDRAAIAIMGEISRTPTCNLNRCRHQSR